jgi:hypothetical protein
MSNLPLSVLPPPSTRHPLDKPTEHHRADPNPKQKRIWSIIAAANPGQKVIIGYGGAAGGGKTRGLVELAFDRAMDNPGCRILIGRKDLKDLRSTTMDQFDQHAPPGLVVKRNNVDHTRSIRMANWPTGVYSTIFFRELKDWMGLGSEEFTDAYIDEAGETAANAARMLLGRLRHTLPDIIMRTEKTQKTPWGRKTSEFPDGKPVKYVFLAASNPYPGWFKEWFIDGVLDDSLGDIPLHFVKALPSDNPYLPENYEADLRALWPQDWVRRLMEGRWDAFTGQVYPQFSTKLHLWLPKLPPENTWKRIIGGLDFGGQNPYDHYSAGIIAVELKNNRLIRVAEFENRGPGVVDRQINWMMAQQDRWCKPSTVPNRIHWCADRSQTVAIAMWQKMGFLVTPSKGGWDSVDMGIAMVGRRLDPDPGGLPGSFYTQDCIRFPERMSSYRYGEPIDGDSYAKRRPLDRLTDICDADRYMHELVESTYGSPAQGQMPTIEQSPGVGVEYAVKGRQPIHSQRLLNALQMPTFKSQRKATDWFSELMRNQKK